MSGSCYLKYKYSVKISPNTITMKKKCNVVMLSTNKKTKLFLRVDKPSLLLYNVSVGQSKTSMTHQGYYLYITSDDEIKEGDWFINHYNDVVFATKEIVNDLTINHKKIIASTDPELILCSGCRRSKHIEGAIYTCSCKALCIPQIPLSFIKEYVKTPVDKVMVEFNEEGIVKIGRGGERTIIISPLEEKMYSREEVITLIDDLLMTYPEMLGTHIWSIKGKWIKENL